MLGHGTHLYMWENWDGLQEVNFALDIYRKIFISKYRNSDYAVIKYEYAFNFY